MSTNSSNTVTKHVLNVVANHVSWQSGPNSRGTFEILALCLSTIFFVIWTVYHPDVPTTILPQSRRHKHASLEPLGMVALFLLAPELLPITAAIELRKAWILYHGVGSMAAIRESNMQWTLTHAFYVLMGGFTFVDMAGTIHFLTPDELIEVVEKRLFSDKFDFISKKAIKNRTRRDNLSKGITVIQITSFFVLLASRWAQKLPLSILETSSFAYIISAAIAYLLWWSKPDTVQKSIFIDITTCPLLEFCTEKDTCAKMHWKNPPDETFFRRLYQDLEIVPCYLRVFVGLSGPVIYGSLHLLAWNTPLPSVTEVLLWKSAVIGVIAIGPVILYLQFLGFNILHWFRKSEQGDSDHHLTTGKIVDALVRWATLIAIIAYVLARLYMLEEAFRQLFYLPPDSFKVPSWSNYIPRFS